MEETSKKVRHTAEMEERRREVYQKVLNDGWKDVVGYEGLYIISPSGVVEALPRIISYVIADNRRFKGCVMKQYLRYKTSKYPSVTLTKDKVERCWFVHRLVALAFIPNPANKPQINHLDHNKFNNHFSNLEWCTAQENTLHTIRAGMRSTARGENQAIAVLKDSDVPEIFKLNMSGVSTMDIALRYSTVPNIISNVLSRKTYSHVPIDDPTYFDHKRNVLCQYGEPLNDDNEYTFQEFKSVYL